MQKNYPSHLSRHTQANPPFGFSSSSARPVEFVGRVAGALLAILGALIGLIPGLYFSVSELLSYAIVVVAASSFLMAWAGFLAGYLPFAALSFTLGERENPAESLKVRP